MKRINLLSGRRFAALPRLHRIELTERTQAAFLACAAAIALISILSFCETRRIIQAQYDNDIARAHLAEVEHREAELHTVAQALSSLGTIARTVEDTRERSARRLTHVTHLGDIMPDGLWLTSVTAAQGTIAIQGRARDTAVIGAALRNLEHDHLFKQPRLIHAREHDEAGSRFIDFEFSVDLGEKT